MYRELVERENIWLSKLFLAEFKEKNILRKQIENAKVEGFRYSDCVYLKFYIERMVEKYPYQVRVPIEMVAYQTASAPVLWLLHVVNGLIDELEILTADGSQIDVDDISLDKLEYIVDEEVAIGQGED